MTAATPPQPTPSDRPAVAPPAVPGAAAPRSVTGPAVGASSARTAVLTLAVLVVTLMVSYSVYEMGGLSRLPRVLAWLVQPLVAVALALVGVAWIQRLPFGRALSELGLRAPVVPAILFALFATLPMAVGYGLADDPIVNLDPLTLLFTLLVWPFVEELLFIGFAFRQLYRRARWGFFAAALVPPLVFAVLHVGNAFFADQDLRIPLLAAGMAIVGGVFLAWLFIAWQDNLWVPVLLHGMMNFWWEGFGVDRTGIGTLGSNLLRLSTVVLAVVLTLLRDRLPLGLRGYSEPEPVRAEVA